MSKLTIIGIILAIVAMIGIVITIILTAALPWGFWMGAQSAENEYDDWFRSANTGDEITVSGTIDGREDAKLYSMPSGYLYKFKGCDQKFYSTHDIGDEKDIILVKIRVQAATGPTSYKEYKTPITVGPNGCCCFLSGSFFLIGGILFISGLVRGKKKSTPEE
jgi:hypothetical protein